MFRYSFIIYILFIVTVSLHAQDVDQMALIGNKIPAVRLHLLEIPKPPSLPEIILPVPGKRKETFTPMNRMDTEQEVDSALTELRRKYLPFMANLAPLQKSMRKSMILNQFNWRTETVSDRKDFLGVLQGKGAWEKVTIPHYGPPLGKAVTYYRTTFSLNKDLLSDGALYIRFKGVDYQATVFVNGYHVGFHEGIFAPFEFEILKYAQEGENTLLVKVENDYPAGGHVGEDGRKFNGDKIYAATGPGYNDPILGWHHSPPAMGIAQDVFIESRAPVHISDVFIRPLGLSDTAEVWLEINNSQVENHIIQIQHSIYGQNFSQTVYEKATYQPITIHVPGVGDLVKPTDNQITELPMGPGVNFIRFPVVIPSSRKWDIESPWLYQIQLQLISEGKTVDNYSSHFGMRSFTMDTLSTPKGMMYLNGIPIRLRGANTMGAFQRSVMKKDWDQLLEDILLAKLTNMNFIRMTQLPVQEEIYDYCDKLGLMTQTDLPLFGVLRRNKWMEAVKQAEEMERLVRRHPSNIMVTYINERFPNAEGNPQRHLNTYEDFKKFFTAADQAVLMNNPDRVIKAGDGDYDPPSPGLPDNHVYNGWYNGHGIGIGELQKGHWVPVKPGWYFACGEFGSEALDNYTTMLKYYPKEWLPSSVSEKWTPEKISMNQTFRFHRMWYATPHTIEEWIKSSQEHQAKITRLTTEAFRRENRMVSFGIHLFIDAWPAGWMKSIMDVERKPKQAWYEYRHALEPLAIQIRTDRYQFESGETMRPEIWIANDKATLPGNMRIVYQLEKAKKPLSSNSIPAVIKANLSTFQGIVTFTAPNVTQRTVYTLRVGLLDNHKVVHESFVNVTVNPRIKLPTPKVFAIGKISQSLVHELTWTSGTMENAEVILLDSIQYYNTNKQKIDEWVLKGKKVVFFEIPNGEHQIGSSSISVKPTIMGSYYYTQPVDRSGFSEFKPDDFQFWYECKSGMIQPFLKSMVNHTDWNEILRTGTTSWTAESTWSSAVCEKKSGKGKYVVCQLQLHGRLNHNPAAKKLFIMMIK